MMNLAIQIVRTPSWVMLAISSQLTANSLTRWKHASTTCISWAALQPARTTDSCGAWIASIEMQFTSWNSFISESKSRVGWKCHKLVEGKKLLICRLISIQFDIPFPPCSGAHAPSLDIPLPTHSISLFIHSENHFYCGSPSKESDQQIVVVVGQFRLWLFVVFLSSFYFELFFLSVSSFARKKANRKPKPHRMT